LCPLERVISRNNADLSAVDIDQSNLTGDDGFVDGGALGRRLPLTSSLDIAISDRITKAIALTSANSNAKEG